MTQAANDFDFFYDLATDEVASKEGKLFKFRNGAEFRIANANGREFRLACARAWRDLMAEQKSKGLSDELKTYSEEQQSEFAKQVMRTAAAEVVLLGWEGEIPFKGEKLAYSTENAARLLTVDVFSQWVDSISTDDGNFRVSRPTEEDTKN